MIDNVIVTRLDLECDHCGVRLKAVVSDAVTLGRARAAAVEAGWRKLRCRAHRFEGCGCRAAAETDLDLCATCASLIVDRRRLTPTDTAVASLFDTADPTTSERS